MPSPLERRRRYEEAVRSLAGVARTLQLNGWSEEEIARELVATRNSLKREIRLEDPPEILALITARNLARYGDPVGPDADTLFRKYGAWSAVIEAACRPAKLS